MATEITVRPGPELAIEEVVCLENMLARSMWRTYETEFIKRNIVILKEATRAGLSRVPEGYALSLRLIDPMLRARWDFTCDMWAIERWAEGKDEGGLTFNRWVFIAHRQFLDNKLIHDLKKGDTWKDGKSPEQHLREKREEADRVKAANEAASNEKVLEAVDSLPADHIQRFVEVEEALASGERIHARGQDFDTLNRMQQSQKRALARGTYKPPDPTPINAGKQRFKVRKRRKK
jgi:hypothetical protein